MSNDYEYELVDHTLSNDQKVSVYEIKLSGGRVQKVKPVSPDVWIPFYAANPEPVEPVQEKESEAGHTIEMPYSPDSDEILAYSKELDAYWKRIGPLVVETEWLDAFQDNILAVPDEWDVPTHYKRAGIEKETDPFDLKIQYIRFAIIQSPQDRAAIQWAVNGGREITRQELEAAASNFL